MSKKLLSEAQVRRFAKLANLSPINEMYSKKDDDKEDKVEEGSYGMHKRDHDDKDDKMEEGAYGMHKRHDDEDKMEEGAYGMHKRDHDEDTMKEDAMADEIEDVKMDDDSLPEPDREEMDDIEMEEAGLTQDQAQDLTSKLVSAIADVMGVDVEVSDDMDDVDVDMDDDMDDDMGDDMDAPDMGAEDEIMEALNGINYVPERSEIVNEVARRVAKRLLRAKKAEVQLNEALGRNSSKK